MRISPITNTPIITKPAFKQKPNLKILKKEEAQALLDNYESITREHFKDGYIYKGLAKLNFDKYKDNGKQNLENFKKLYTHTLINLGLKIEELRLDVAFDEGIENSNYHFLKVMVSEMGMLPIKPDGKVDRLMYYSGHRSRGIYSHCIEDLLTSAHKNVRYGDTIFGNYVPQARDNSAKRTLLKESKDMINKDEETEGVVSVNTIYKIVSDPNFNKIKDESLNISGSRILHLLSESSFDATNMQENALVQVIIQKCADAGYDFDIKNDFGETALDKAREAENHFLIDLISKRRTK